VDALTDAEIEKKAGSLPDLEEFFRVQYPYIARLIARVIHNPGRAEEIAVDVFLKWAHQPCHGDKATGWLRRTAIHLALDELRKQVRRNRYERLLTSFRKPRTPEEIHCAQEKQQRVLAILNALAPRQAELLLLRSEGLDYQELARALDLNPASVGTLLSRAQQTFRKEYLNKYGQEE